MKFILSILFLFIFQLSKSQAVYCPPNIDFENGNYGYWKFFRGTCCPISTPTAGQAVGRHTLTSGPALDPIGGFPILAPGGGSYSLKLGNTSTGSQAERATYNVQVPAGVNNYSLIYRYAVVFQDPGHTPADQPRFEVKAYDSATNLPVPCTQYTYVAGSNLPGFTCVSGKCFRSWATASLDLSGLGGKTIIVSFATGDCDQGAHYGYGYIDLACALFQVSNIVCSNQPTQNLNAPPGFQTYTWYDSNYVNVLASGQNVVINTPTYNTSYHLVLTPFPGYGCSDTLSGSFIITNPTFSNLYDTICYNQSYLGYTTSGTYTDTLQGANGCDSFRTLHLVVLPKSDTIINKTICTGESFLGYSITGTFIDTFQNSRGCDSTRKINLTVNQITLNSINQTICQGDTFLNHFLTGTYIDTFQNVNGCDSILTVNLTVKPKTNSTINQSICYGQSFFGYNTSGTYNDTLVNSNGCDSVRTLVLTVNPILTSVINQTLCFGQSYLGYNASGTYIDTLTNSVGCKTKRTINLTIRPRRDTVINKSICPGQNYWGYTSAGTYKDTFINMYNCDSIRTINLVINPTYTNTVTQIICQGQSYLGYNTTGIYSDTFQTIYGCDSIRILNLTVSPYLTSTINQTICQGQNYQGYTSAGTYKDTLQNSNGCDSIRTINLIVNPKSSINISQSICQGQSFLGYTTAGVHIDTFQNQYGCDSVRKLTLTVKPITYSTINQTICFPNSFLGYNTTGTFLDTFINANGCDSIRKINLIVNVPTASTILDTICEGQNRFGYTTTGIYVDNFINSKGCDSARTLKLYVKKNSSFTYNYEMCSGETYLGHSTTGTYIDTFINSLGCDSVLTLNIIVHPVYVVDTAITLCIGDSLFVGKAWQTVNGVYKDTFSSIYGCDSIKRTTLKFTNNLNPNIIGDSTFCQGDSVLLFVKKFKHYLWNTGDTTDRITVYNTGQYIIRVTNDNYCFANDTINVDMKLLPNVSLSFTNRELCKYDTIQLSASGASNYYWYTPDMNRLIGSQNPINYSIERTPITVYLKGVDENNCVNYDSVTLYYVNCCGSIFVPNAFSPNGDGKNDVFKPTFNQVKFDKYIFQVFNRYGQKVFETNNMRTYWDGKQNGDTCDIGTYYYLIKTNCFDSQEDKIISGDINLLR
jgi:gliding motility-associated-like protein